MFSELENLISNEAERFLRKVLGISKLKYCWQVLITSILLDAKTTLSRGFSSLKKSLGNQPTRIIVVNRFDKTKLLNSNA